MEIKNKLTHEDVLSKLDKKTRDRVVLASEIKIERLPWASLGLNAATGGLARGRIHLLYGGRSTGKSLLAMQTIGKLQRELGLTAAVIDSEGTTDPEFADKFGVVTNQLMVTHDKSFLGAGKSAKEFLSAGVDILLIDSTSTLIPDAFLDGDDIKDSDGQKQIGANAKATGILMNTLHYANEHDTIVIVISQARMNLAGQHAALTFTGGKALEHAASQIVRLTASGAESQQIKGNVVINGRAFQKPVGREVNLFVEKNKLGPASSTVKYKMYYDGDNVGIDTFEETVTLGIEYGVVEKAGAWLKYEGMQWQGSVNMATALNEDEVLFKQLQADVSEAMGV